MVSAPGFEVLSGKIDSISENEIVIFSKVKRSSKYVRVLVPMNDSVMFVGKNMGKLGDIVVRLNVASEAHSDVVHSVKAGPGGMLSGVNAEGSVVHFRPTFSNLTSDKMDAPAGVSTKKGKKNKKDKKASKLEKGKSKAAKKTGKKSKESWD